MAPGAQVDLISYLSGAGLAALVNFPLWKAAAIGQSGFTAQGPTFFARLKVLLGPPYKGVAATLFGMTWARAAIFYCADAGRDRMLALGASPAAATALPAVGISTLVQVVNQPIVRGTITIQDPSSRHAGLVAALRHIHATRGVSGLWHGALSLTLALHSRCEPGTPLSSSSLLLLRLLLTFPPALAFFSRLTSPPPPPSPSPPPSPRPRHLRHRRRRMHSTCSRPYTVSPTASGAKPLAPFPNADPQTPRHGSRGGKDGAEVCRGDLGVWQGAGQEAASANHQLRRVARDELGEGRDARAAAEADGAARRARPQVTGPPGARMPNK